MAALAEPFSHTPIPLVRDLREFRSVHLQALLQAEEREWGGTLDWDFAKSADLVRKFVDLGNLCGAALVNSVGVIGYTYFVFEENKGLVGDLYVRQDFRTSHYENLLINAVMDQIAKTGNVLRVESQLMLLSAPLSKPDRYWPVYGVFRRSFLSLQLPAAETGISAELPGGIAIVPWNPAYQEEAAHLIPATYQGHVDSRINDQYLSVPGARKFLHNIMQYPGCGEFHSAASLAAFDRANSRMCGMVLSSIVAERSGHITQVCVDPRYQGLGLGRELLRGAVRLLEREGCRVVSLTVTTENRAARMLYERIGFREVRKFGAYVWEA